MEEKKDHLLEELRNKYLNAVRGQSENKKRIDEIFDALRNLVDSKTYFQGQKVIPSRDYPHCLEWKREEQYVPKTRIPCVEQTDALPALQSATARIMKQKTSRIENAICSDRKPTQQEVNEISLLFQNTLRTLFIDKAIEFLSELYNLGIRNPPSGMKFAISRAFGSQGCYAARISSIAKAIQELQEAEKTGRFWSLEQVKSEFKNSEWNQIVDKLITVAYDIGLRDQDIEGWIAQQIYEHKIYPSHVSKTLSKPLIDHIVSLCYKEIIEGEEKSADCGKRSMEQFMLKDITKVSRSIIGRTWLGIITYLIGLAKELQYRNPEDIKSWITKVIIENELHRKGKGLPFDEATVSKMVEICFNAISQKNTKLMDYCSRGKVSF